MARGSGDNKTLRDKLIDVMYENEQLKAENSKLREILDKAYDFMKQLVIDGRNLLERFLESIGQMVEKVRDSLRRQERGIGGGAPFKIVPGNTMKYHKNTLKTQNIRATLLIVIKKQEILHYG